MKAHLKSSSSLTVRRSVALPRRLIEEIADVAPVEASRNWNRLVITALEEYAQRKRRVKLEAMMAEMAADPGIRSEMKVADRMFRKTEEDGLT